MMRLTSIAAAFLAALLLAAGHTAFAHSQSYGYLNVSLGERSVDGTLEIAARDLDTLFDLDGNRDGQITWGEFRSREASIVAAVLQRISIGARSGSCSLSGRPVLVDSRGGESTIVIPFAGSCGSLAGPLDIGYRLLFDVDAQHRGLVGVATADGARNFVMTPAQSHVMLSLGAGGWAGLMLTYVRHGIEHILIGYDHILFVLTLMIGAAVQRRDGPVWRVFAESAKVVTAFTLSHSMTLGLAAFGILRIPVALTESLIAATIAVAALNNVWPLVSRRIWLVALVFGLVHGLGFANVLADLGLPRDSLLASLLAFNVGVEIGQLAIVVAALPPIALAVRRSLGQRAVPAANLAIAAVALLWFSDRALGTALLPF
jgi:hypothetical protein